MSNTRDDITLPADTWVNVYSATSIAVGTALQIFNKGNTIILCTIKATAPTNNTIGVPLFPNRNDSNLFISAGESGFWVLSKGAVGYLNVQEV